MDKLNKLFTNITAINPFAIPKLINEDENYYYFSINGGWVSEISKERLNAVQDYQMYTEAKWILDNYKTGL